MGILLTPGLGFTQGLWDDEKDRKKAIIHSIIAMFRNSGRAGGKV